MKKTLTVNLGGLVFNIDDNAFVILKKYLDTIKGYFDNSEGRDEIMTDIESRIAEMLQEKMHGGKEVVNATDINEVIAIMGQPEDYITEDMDEEPTHTSSNYQSQQTNYQYTTSTRRLFRDKESNAVGGVCSGIGYYFGIDPLWIRLAFVLAVLFAGTGVLFYIILWIIIPEARTPSEKLAMKGEPVTFDNIGKTVEDELKNVKKKLNNLDGNHAESIKNGASKIGEFILSLFRFAIKAIGKILGFIFIIIGVLILISIFFGTFIPINIMFLDSVEFTNLVFVTGSDFWMSIIGGSLLIGIPFLGLVMAGFILLFNAKMPKYTGMVLAIGWIIGLVLTTIAAIGTGFDFSKESSISNVSTLVTESDTLYFDILDSKDIVSRSNSSKEVHDIFEIRNGQLITDGVDVDIIMTKSPLPEIEIIKTARANSYDLADERAELLNYTVINDSNVIKIDPYLAIDQEDKWRNQGVRVVLYLPVGKTIYIPRSYKYLLDDVKNYHDTYDKRMVDQYWTMTDSGLVSPVILQKEKQAIIENEEIEFETVELSVTSGDEKHSIIIK